MRKFTQFLMTLALLILGGVNSISAKEQINDVLGIPKTYENIGAWGGAWSGSPLNFDWTAYDYVWVKYSGHSGSMQFGVIYSEYKSHESWGDTFYDATVPFEGTSGVVGIKLDKTTVYVKGDAAEGGKYIGDVYAKHIRQLFIQATSGGSGVKLEEMWVGSEAEFFADVIEATGFDTSKNHALKVTNGEKKTNLWDYQARYKLSTPITTGKTYVLEAAIKAVNGGETRVKVGEAKDQWLETKGLWTNEFTRHKVEFTAEGANDILEFDLGHIAGDVYIDNVSLVEKGQTTNLVANGDFENPTIAGWSPIGNTIQQVEEELGEVQEAGILVTVGEAGWRTFRTGSNMQISEPSVNAYAAKYVAEGNYIQLTKVTEVPAWQPVLIEAPQGEYLLRSPASVSGFPYDKNDLKANGGEDLPADGTLYGLAKKSGLVGFYKISDKVPAWRIYMQIPPSSSAPAYLGFNGNNTTSIGEPNVKGQADGTYFNLAGQRVAQPTKGLYIVNGKKVVIK